MKVKINTIDGERKKGAFCNPTVSYKFMITTGQRCSGVVSTKSYGDRLKAYDAGVRFCRKPGLEYD